MTQSLILCLGAAVLLLVGVLITMQIDGDRLVIVQSTFAQTISSGNMTTPMMESASFHLKAADRLLMEGNTEAVNDQINLAEIQLSLLNIGSQETSMNQTQVMEFIVGGSLSSMKMGANCIIDSQAMISCMQ